MADYFAFAPKLLRWEHGFVNDPADSGGATQDGVTLSTYRRYYGQDKTVMDLKHMTREQWNHIMRRYWDFCKADQIHSQSIADIIVDWYVNSGFVALKKVQKILGVEQDGKFGPITIGAINSRSAKCLHCQIKDARREHYENICRVNPSQCKFLNGWLNRLTDYVYED